jgi:hypothetical protein
MVNFLYAVHRAADGVVQLLTWPVVTLAALLIFRRALSALIAGLGSRITKLSLFKVELELAAAEPKRALSVTLSQLRDTTQAAVSDSAGSLFTQLQETTPADFAVIDLGAGSEWITSRLFIAAAVLERMRGLRVMVFVESRQRLTGCFLALASPSFVRWSLARRYPWLELAYAQATERIIASVAFARPAPVTPATPPLVFYAADGIVTSARGTLAGDLAKTLTREFLTKIQVTNGAPAPGSPDEWVNLTTYREHASYVTSSLLREFLPSSAFEQQMNEMRDEPQAKRVRAVLRRPGQFVALLDGEGRFKRLVDRSALLEEAAVQLSEEPNAWPS